MRILNIVLTLIFILCALVQYNDPDPYIWVPIYLFCAWVCGSAAMGKYNQKLIVVGLIPISIYMLFYIPDFVNWISNGMFSLVETQKANRLDVELTREFGGLAICVAALAFEYFQSRKMAK